MKKEDLFYLNDIEKAEIQKFLENPTMLEAVRKVLLESIYFSGTLKEGETAESGRNFILGQLTQPIMENAPMEEYGMYTKALINGIRLLETGFQNLEKLRKVEQVKPKAQKGR